MPDCQVCLRIAFLIKSRLFVITLVNNKDSFIKNGRSNEPSLKQITYANPGLKGPDQEGSGDRQGDWNTVGGGEGGRGANSKS